MFIYIEDLSRDSDTGIILSVCWRASKEINFVCASYSKESYLKRISVDNKCFIIFKDVKKENVLAWLQEVEDFDLIEFLLDNQLKEKLYPKVKHGLPWKMYFNEDQKL